MLAGIEHQSETLAYNKKIVTILITLELVLFYINFNKTEVKSNI